MSITRRTLLAASLCSAAFPHALRAQARSRIGILSGLPREKSLLTPMLLKDLAARGYHEGKTLELVFRSADGRPERYGALARELVDAKCHLVFTLANIQSARAVTSLGASVPVVLLALEYDPVEEGIVKSLARPGGNVTGVFAPAALLMAKNVEIIREVLPAVTRILVLADPIARPQLPALKAAAARTGLILSLVEYDKPPYDLRVAAEAIRRDKPQAVIVPLSAGFVAQQRELSALLVESSLPAVVPTFMVREPGAFVSYGVDFPQVAKRAAGMADRILKGARPRDLPIEQIDEFSLTINIRTAKALGVKVPYSVLARAHSVIE